MNTVELENLKIPLPPLDVQHRLVAQVQADRSAIATLRSRATHLRATITQEVEEMILGRWAAPQ